MMTKSALQEILTRQDPLSDAALDSLIAHREEELYVDYKETFDRSEKGWLDLTIDVMSFANTNGGFLLFGVRDASFEPVGLAEDVAGVLSDTNLFIQKVNRFISPPVSLLRSKRFIRNGMTFVAVYIPESVGKTHVVVKEGAYILPSGEKRILLRLGMIFTRRSASNQVVTPEDLDLIIQRRLEHFRASLLGKIARVVEAPPEHQILVFDPRSTSSGEKTFVISDAPEAIPIKGMSFTIAPQTDEQEIASWMALAGKDTDFLPRPQQLWLLYSKRHSLKLSTPQLAVMVSFSLLAGAPAFYWMRDLSSEVIREAIICAVRGKSAMNEKECILHTAFFLGKGFFTDVFRRFGKYADRLHRGSKSVGGSGPREWFSPRLVASLKRPEHKSEPQFQNYLETELLRLAVNLGKDQGGVLERTKAKAIDCYLYARDDKYQKDARERQSPETEVAAGQ